MREDISTNQLDEQLGLFLSSSAEWQASAEIIIANINRLSGDRVVAFLRNLDERMKKENSESRWYWPVASVAAPLKNKAIEQLQPKADEDNYALFLYFSEQKNYVGNEELWSAFFLLVMDRYEHYSDKQKMDFFINAGRRHPELIPHFLSETTHGWNLFLIASKAENYTDYEKLWLALAAGFTGITEKNSTQRALDLLDELSRHPEHEDVKEMTALIIEWLAIDINTMSAETKFRLFMFLSKPENDYSGVQAVAFLRKLDDSVESQEVKDKVLTTFQPKTPQDHLALFLYYADKDPEGRNIKWWLGLAVEVLKKIEDFTEKQVSRFLHVLNEHREKDKAFVTLMTKRVVAKPVTAELPEEKISLFVVLSKRATFEHNYEKWFLLANQMVGNIEKNREQYTVKQLLTFIRMLNKHGEMGLKTRAANVLAESLESCVNSTADKFFLSSERSAARQLAYGLKGGITFFANRYLKKAIQGQDEKMSALVSKLTVSAPAA
ncbi:MAG TPA: hypothetical protein VGV92_00930 [Gammaproteobacteria bacterium]|nr:hypothetical protein [Gammaproteobacteria bacterium]